MIYQPIAEPYTADDLRREYAIMNDLEMQFLRAQGRYNRMRISYNLTKGT
jgi:hypothetical protein